MKRSSLTLAALALAASLGAQPALKLTLDGSVQAALAASHSLKAAQLEAEAAHDQVKAARAAILPRLSLDGSYRWVKEIPEVKLSPQAPAAKFGDNNNYSLGISATWDIFSGMGTWRQMQVLQAAEAAKAADVAFQERALRLRARLAYYQTQLAATKLRLLAQSLNLAQSQDQDLQLRLKAGSSSRIDALSASDDELDRRAEFRLAQADLAAALRELFALTGEGQNADLSLPMVDDSGQSLPARVEQPSLTVSFEDTGSLLGELQDAGSKPFAAEKLPRMLSLQALVDMARRQADATYAQHWPHGSLGAKQSLDYPNGPVLEQVNQTQFSAGVSIPLYSFGAVADQVDAGVAQANAAAERQAEALTGLQRDYAKSRDRLAALKAQRELMRQRSAQAADLQNLVYRAYKIGGANYLEVQSSSLRALQAGLDLAVTETQMLIELANLSALTEADR